VYNYSQMQPDLGFVAEIGGGKDRGKVAVRNFLVPRAEYHVRVRERAVSNATGCLSVLE
jgi:hypothetical protein